MRSSLILATFLLLALPSGSTASPDLDRSDAAYARRAEGQVDGRARPEPIGEAITGYEAALVTEPRNLVAYWKLMRALWFSGDFASEDSSRRRAAYERATSISERALALVAERVGGRDSLGAMSPEALRAKLPATEVGNVARIYFWSAINLGAWSRLAGLLQAVRAGVANRLHEYTLRVIALDPGVDDGGALRLLSRLHASLPRVPLLSGWVDRTQALPIAERAFAAYPGHPGNSYLLALAILEADPARRAEALSLLERTANLEPRPDELVEDLAIRRDARERLAGERARDRSRS